MKVSKNPQRGSRIIAEGAHMLPAASLMMAEGVIRSLDDVKKPLVTAINSYSNQIPGHAHLDKIGAVVRGNCRRYKSIPAILKELDCHAASGLRPTVTGKLADVVASAPDPDGDVIRTASNALSSRPRRTLRQPGAERRCGKGCRR
mgnify:CR=1 FL=1